MTSEMFTPEEIDQLNRDFTDTEAAPDEFGCDVATTRRLLATINTLSQEIDREHRKFRELLAQIAWTITVPPPLTHTEKSALERCDELLEAIQHELRGACHVRPLRMAIADRLRNPETTP